MQTQTESNNLNRNVAPSFKAREFMCPCCYKEGVKDDLVIHLQMAHNLLPKPNVMIITSSYRCPEHNKEVGGKETSSHLEGLAADIKCDNPTYRFNLLTALTRVGFKRIGIGKDFIHVDLDGNKDQNIIWNY